MRIIVSFFLIILMGCSPIWNKATINTNWDDTKRCRLSYTGPILDTLGFFTAGFLILAYKYDNKKVLQNHSGGKRNQREFLTFNAIAGIIYMISAYTGYMKSSLDICNKIKE